LRTHTHTQNMSKNISVSDEVYEMLKREKGDRSFSDVIREKLEEGGKIEDVAGQGVLDSETYEEVKEDIREMSDGTLERLDEDT
jgi:predicted CopG family antitoxin